MGDLLIRGGKVVTARKTGVASVYVKDGRIARVGKFSKVAGEMVEASGLLVLPGAIDAHVHFALPVAGTRSADDFVSGSSAAVAGGVTCFIDFTLGSGESSLPEAVEKRLAQARESLVDFSLHVEMIGWQKERVSEIYAVKDLGLRSFKFYLAYSESGRRTDLGTLFVAMKAIREIGGVAMIHAEADELVDPKGGPFPWARPSLSEEVAIMEVGSLSRETGCPTYIAHISSALGFQALLRGRRMGAPLMGETCPHYLVLDESVYTCPDGHLFSVTPPLRTKEDQRALWEGLRKRAFQAVATDHCPFTRAQKAPFKDEPARIPSGLPGVETLLPLLYHFGVVQGILRLEDLAWYLAEGPAKAFGLWPRKGAIRPGADADLVLLDPQGSWKIEARNLHMATDFSPYEGWVLQGKIVGVLSRGEWVYRDGEILGRPGRGMFIPWQK